MTRADKEAILEQIEECRRNHPYNGNDRDKGIYDVCACLSAFIDLMPESPAENSS